MLPRIFVLIFGISILVAASDLKNEDQEGIKLSLEKLKFIPKEILCTLCHNVVNKLRFSLMENPAAFQTNMLKSCENYPDPNDQVKCREAFQNREKIEKLLEPDAPTKMCREKKLCGEDELPLPPNAYPIVGPRPLPKDLRPIPKIDHPVIPNDPVPPPVFPEDSESTIE